MGPVQTGDTPGVGAPRMDTPPGVHAPGASAAEQPREQNKPGAGTAPKRLYQIREGAMLSGVCMGIAAYLNIDVTVVRIVFVLLTLLTGGIWILVYIAPPRFAQTRTYAGAGCR
jgi:phage shock protein PspC (stress-responsive transcriptional regulator)